VSKSGLLGRLGHFVQRPAGARRHRRCNGAFDERCVDQADVTVTVRREHITYGEDGATKIAKDYDAVALVGLSDGITDRLVAGAEASIRTAASRPDRHFASRDLLGQLGKAPRQGAAV
jgi:hypothetical protein